MTNVNELNLNGEKLDLKELEQVDGGFAFGALASSDKILIFGKDLASPLAVDSKELALEIIDKIKNNQITDEQLASIASPIFIESDKLASEIFPIY